MKHPTYDASDPKAGQPVLVGDEVWFESIRGGPCSVKAEVSAIEMATAGMLIKFDNGHAYSVAISKWFSRPPQPQIEPCVCGAIPIVRTCHRVKCQSCHRSGPDKPTDAAAVTAWNADMRLLKAFPNLDLQEIADLMGLSTGETISDKIATYIRGLQEQAWSLQ